MYRCRLRAVRLFGQLLHLCSFPAKSTPSRAQRSSRNWLRACSGAAPRGPSNRARPVSCTGRPRIQQRPPAVQTLRSNRRRSEHHAARKPVVHLRRRGRAEDHASDDSVRTDAGSWWFKTQGERQRRVNQNLRDTCRAPRVTDPYDGEIHATATGLSVDPRSATGPCANITIVAQRLAQTGGRCKALPRCEGDSAPYGIAVDHGYCDRTDISLTLAPQCRRRSSPPSSRRRLHRMANSAARPALCFRRNGRS
jgi:hypothetical protein